MEICKMETDRSFYRRRPGEGGGRVKAPGCYGEVRIAKWFLSLWWDAFLCFLAEKVSIVFGIALACSIILLACCMKLLIVQHFNQRPQFQDTIQHLRITSWASWGLGQVTLLSGMWKMTIIQQKRKNASKFHSNIQVAERAYLMNMA